MTQRYTDPLAIARMENGTCPECGRDTRQHTGWGSGSCSLTDMGVASRLDQYRRDKEAAEGSAVTGINVDEIIAFIKARLSEEEAAARAVKPLGHVYDMGSTRLDESFVHSRRKFASEDGRSRIESDPEAADHFARYGPESVQHRAAVQRCLLDWAVAYYRDGARTSTPVTLLSNAARQAIQVQAMSWVKHPDYKPEWKPQWL